MQWKTIEECMEIHSRTTTTTTQDDKQEEKSSRNNTFNSTAADAAAAAVLDAAPLVAVLDGDQSDGCYATLAAIVGVTANNKEKVKQNNNNNNNNLDTNKKNNEDADDHFRGESLAKIGGRGTTTAATTTPTTTGAGKIYSADGSKIRLLGIGRAKLHHFQKIDTDEGPVLMARMDLLQDEAQSPPGAAGKSPVHVVSEMATWASRIGYIHQDRRKITQGLQAANVRLQMASINWQDHDGIGDLFFKEEQQQQQEGKQQKKKNSMQHHQKEEESSTSTSSTTKEELQDKIDAMLATFVQTGQSRPLSDASARLLQLKNFGLGNSPASLAKLEPLTAVLIERLQPYYSPKLLSMEEFYYGVYSFVALTSLESYLDRSHLTWALRSVDTVDRLKRVYGWMSEHRQLLQEVAESKSQELSDCGEECTDLW
jgi:hypothetical protein